MVVVSEPASCPKCGAPRRDERACPRCGLASEHMAAFAQQRDAAVPEVLVAAWGRTLDGWAEPARHDELLRLIAQHDGYAWAAAKYRDTERTRPGDAVAARQLERLRRAAEVTLLASATVREDRSPTPYRATTAVLAMLIIAAIAGLLYAIVVRDRGAPSVPNATPHGPVRPLQPLSPPSTK